MVQVLEQNQIANSYEEERNKPMPSYHHGKLQAKIIFQLMKNYEDKYDILSEISIKLDNWGATPDAGIYPLQHIAYNQHDIIKMDTPPLCAIEILSPTQSLDELIEKSEHYFLKGTKSYWLVLPKLESILVYEQPFNYAIFRKYEVLKDNNLNIEIDLKEVFK